MEFSSNFFLMDEVCFFRGKVPQIALFKMKKNCLYVGVFKIRSMHTRKSFHSVCFSSSIRLIFIETGLDAASARNVMKTVKRLSATRAVDHLYCN